MSVSNKSKNGFTAAVLPAASAYVAGITVDPGGADIARLFVTYTTNASGANGRPEWKVEISPDDGTTWAAYAVGSDAAASQTGLTNDIDEWEAQLYNRVWTIDTPAGASKTVQVPVMEFDCRGVTRFRVTPREVGDTTNRGTFSATWVFGRVLR
jgi:hypothetical protein